MKSVLDSLLDRRSIRRYEREPLTQEQIDFIYKAILNTPTSYNGQQFSVVDISDPGIKMHLYEITGQKQIKTCAHFFVFCADYHRIHVAAEAKGHEWPQINDTVDGAIVAVIDASLAMMSAVVAAESLGLGTCPVGYVRTAAPEAVSSLLNLPDEVFAVCGLAVGVPREYPDMKPKMSRRLLIHDNKYRSDDVSAEVLEYDRQIAEYTTLRSGDVKIHDWIGNMLSYYTEAMDFDMLSALRLRGFGLKK